MYEIRATLNFVEWQLGKDHNRQEHMYTIVKWDWKDSEAYRMSETRYYLVTARRGRNVPSPWSTGSAHSPQLFGRSRRCHRSGRRRRIRKPPSPHEIHGEAAAMDPQPCLGEDITGHRRGHVGWTTAPSWSGMHVSVRGSAVGAGRGRTSSGINFFPI